MDVNSQTITLVVGSAYDRRLAEHVLRGFKHQHAILDYNDPQDRSRLAHLHTDIVIVFHRTSVDIPKPCIPSTRPTRMIVLSDCHDENTIIETLNAGAHHYFDINESDFVLKVRLEAALRSQMHHAMNTLELAPFTFNVKRRSVTKDGKQVHLSPREFSLAYFLFSNHDRVVFDSELMVSIWTLPSSMDSRRIDTAICRVRKKMNLCESDSGWSLRRLRQVGYELVSHSPSRFKNAESDSSQFVGTPQRLPTNPQKMRQKYTSKPTLADANYPPVRPAVLGV